jgi:S-adenosylmethionine/arginine decarboxylase-like enzyme
MEAKMNNHSMWINNTDPYYLKETFTGILKRSGFGIEGEIEKFFSPFGYTLLILLSESHFAIHTFPEEGKAYIEMSSCIDDPYFRYIKELKDGIPNIDEIKV